MAQQRKTLLTLVDGSGAPETVNIAALDDPKITLFADNFQDSVLEKFDPVKMPILAAHFFGLIGEPSQLTTSYRIQRLPADKNSIEKHHLNLQFQEGGNVK